MPLDLYRPSLALLTDLYQLTMVCAAWKNGRHNTPAVFHLSFRKNPFAGGYTIAAGLAPAVEWLSALRFTDDDVDYLRSLLGADRSPLFPDDFLRWLRATPITLDLDAAPEGSLVFPHEPLVRVRGPLWQCQLIETAFLNLINFQSLIATKAARICSAAAGDPVIDFGLRRAQGIDGAISATRAAWIGGIAATSNVLAGKLLGIPVRGTHAHSWVMSFDTELEAFHAYARAMPHNTLLLVDTYDTLEGVRHAITVAASLHATGHRLLGIRLDSGDLAYLSIKARELLDAAGLTDAKIVASNDLDEHTIQSLKHQGAKVDTWGVGTRLITGHDQPALGGVYKLGAMQDPGGSWRPVVKASEQLAKASIPGTLGVRRFTSNGKLVADMIYDQSLAAATSGVIIDPADPIRRRSVSGESSELLQPVMREGQPVAAPASLS
ncbi:MAG: nicotinate phosphoribosyltransferase, partial [Phycisphaerales bacterium]